MVKSSGESSGMGFYLMWWLSLMVDFDQVPLGQSTSTGTTDLSIYAQFWTCMYMLSLRPKLPYLGISHICPSKVGSSVKLLYNIIKIHNLIMFRCTTEKNYIKQMSPENYRTHIQFVYNLHSTWQSSCSLCLTLNDEQKVGSHNLKDV